MGFEIEKLADPRFFEENKLPSHSDHKQEFLNGSGEEIDLNGVWKFKYERNYDYVQKEFASCDYDCSNWEDIRVPAHIQMEGYDAPQYVNVMYPWDGRQESEPGKLPMDFNPIGCYSRNIYIEKKKEGERFIISFQGVESALVVWLNGKYIGYSEGSFLPAEFDLTEAIGEGDNKLALLVFKWSASSWAEDQDFFRFSGIFRSVKLYRYPACYIKDVRVIQELTGDYSIGKVSVFIKAAAKTQARVSLKCLGRTDIGMLRDSYPAVWTAGESKTVASTETWLEAGSGAVEFSVDKPLLWSAEAPNLYEITIETGEVRATTLFGFRHFVIERGIMKLNGKRIVFKGVNRHEFSSVSGRVPQLEELWQDIVTIKRHNINGIRTCHYPNNSPIYELCDRLGIYMIDETDLETHGIWSGILWGGNKDIEEAVPGNKPEWRRMMLDRAQRMYERDKNHPAILMWSCGNEAFGGTNIQAMSDYFHLMDQSRLVHYEGVFNDRRCPDISDVESQMYTSAEDIKNWLKKNKTKPFMLCEYTHAMGNSCGGMFKYTDLTDTLKQFQGGFIWDYVDQSINAKDRYGRDYQKYGGDFDDRPNDYNFSGNGIVYGGSRLPSPKMQEVKYNYQNFTLEPFEEDGSVSVKIINKSLFTDTKDYELRLVLEKEGVCIFERSMKASVKPGKLDVVRDVLKLPQGDGEYVLTASLRTTASYVWAETGHEIAYGQGVFTVSRRTELVTGSARKIKVIHGDSNLGVRGENFEAIFAYSEAGMHSYKYAGRELFKLAPKPDFWRAPIDNDNGNAMQMRYSQWKIASLYQKKSYRGEGLGNPEVKEYENRVEISYYLELAGIPSSQVVLTYTVYENAAVKVKLQYDPAEGVIDMPVFGVMFKLDADYDRLEWYGRGPKEAYNDRMRGARLGLFKGLVKDEMSSYLIPQECGNHTGVRYAKVVNERGRGLLFEGDEMNFSALPYSPHELENATHSIELPPVQFTYVRVAKGQMGVGGDNSWGARTHDEFLMDVSGPVDFEFGFTGV